MFTASHNPAQYNGVKLCLSGARPVGIDTGPRTRSGDSPTGARRRQDRACRRTRHAESNATCSSRSPTTSCRSSTPRRSDRSASSPTPPTAWAGSSCRRCSSASRSSTLEVMYGELDGTFPNHPADPLQPANQRDLQARVMSGGFDIGSGVRRRRRPRVRRRRGRPRDERLDHHGDARRGRPAHPPGRDHPAQPDLLACRARGDPRARRRAGAHQGRPLVHQADHGRDRRGVRRRALGALLLPRQLPRRQRADRVACSCSTSCRARAVDLSVVRKPFERYSASGEINTHVDDVAAVIERRQRGVLQVLARTASTG